MAETLKAASKLLHIIFPFADFVYLLQLEEYDTGRYMKWLARFFLRRNIQKRQQLVYTLRALVTLAVSIGLFVLLILLDIAVFEPVIEYVVLAVLVAAIPLIVALAATALYPLFAILHQLMRVRAARKLADRRLVSSDSEGSQLRIVMIAGSYGKTTTKGFIEALAHHTHRVHMPPGNVNTPAGIAAWINRSLGDQATLLIIEVDGYSREEYLSTVSMVPADIAVITNIGDQHMERFGTRSRLAESLVVVFALARKDARLVTTAAVAEELQQIGADLGARALQVTYAAQPLQYRDTPVRAPHLSQSQLEDLALALKVADILDIPLRFVMDAVQHLPIPERRQRHGLVMGYDGIDDSYNISVSTSRASVAAAREMAGKEGKKLLVVTAGIPELGVEMTDGNVALGALLAREADHTVVLGSIFAPDLERGLKAARHTVIPTLADFASTGQLHWPPSEWFLLLLPELNDLYY